MGKVTGWSCIERRAKIALQLAMTKMHVTSLSSRERRKIAVMSAVRKLWIVAVLTWAATPAAFGQAGWQSRDIGNTLAGSTSIGAGVFTIQGNGNDIWDQADAFRFVYLEGNADCEIMARLTAQQNTDSWAKAGVMIRETLNAGSKHAFMCQTIGNGQAFQDRTQTNGGSDNFNSGAGGVPRWLRLKRQGNVFTGYSAPDNAGRPGAWAVQGNNTVVMGQPVFVGLAVTSHAQGVLCQAVFDNVVTTGTRKAGAGIIVSRLEPRTAPLPYGRVFAPASWMHLPSFTVGLLRSRSVGLLRSSAVARL
jgi:hypothetical protein